MTLSVDMQLERERERLAALDSERADVIERIRRLDAEAAAAGSPSVVPDVSTADGRVALFAELFRGRADVFATRWESRTRPGRAGWAPRCANEWVPGVCEKPRVKCAVCRHRRFVALSHAEVRRHLEGAQTIGVYPLLADETCHLVAIDLDGAGWRDDARAVREAAGEAGVPVLVERSRSGEGAHLWVLFSRPVSARVARTLGSWLLTQAMRRSSLSMASYDRLFPNQDTMPAGGFGNLIALPLQRERRGDGCTVFLDEALEPFADQWGFLAGVVRLDGDRADRLAADAEQAGGALGLARGVDGEPSRMRLPGALVRQTPGPATVPARLSGQLEVTVEALSPELRYRLRRTAAFANPVFHERERARLSTHRTPRVIACHEERAGRLVLPRGCLDDVREELALAGSELVVEDARVDGDPAELAFTGELSAAQDAAVDALAGHEIGVLVAPPGAGKTVMATSLIARRGCSTLVIVHRRPLLEQWVARLSRFLGLAADEIGVLPDGARGRAGAIDVAMVQGLVRRSDTAQLLARYGHVVVDECHHVPAVSVERVLRVAPARFITGLTATPRRRDGHHPIIEMQCGPVRHVLTQAQVQRRDVRKVVFQRRTDFDAALLPPDPGIQEVLGAIARDPSRTRMIVRDALAELATGRSPLLLTERREHLESLTAALEPHVPNLVVLQGGMGVRAARRAAELLASDEPRLIVATGRFIGEGFDDPRLDTLILAMPIAWKGTLIQYAGRLHRDRDEKTEVRIIDYVDHSVPVLRRMFAKRERAYRALGYEISA